MVLDALIVIGSSIGALALRFYDSGIEYNLYDSYAHTAFPIYVLILIAVMYLFKLYNRVWSFASINEFVDILKASVLSELIFIGYHVLKEMYMPRSYYLLQLMLMVIFISLVRFGKRMCGSISEAMSSRKATKRIMIVGAGSAASIIIKELKQKESGARVVCSVDDNSNKKGNYLMGVPIVGNRNSIAYNVEKYNVNEIIIAMPSAGPGTIKEIVLICQDTGKDVKILPSITKSLSDSVLGKVRPINYEDLLGRAPAKINQQGLSDFIKGRVVMVTGGGGSIGSELCRQIISYEPKKLIIFDIYENNAYSIQMELERHYPNADISTLIGSVRDYDRLQFIFEKYRPEVIYHAAAHKHVPLMEKSPNESIKNNCLGTLNLVKLADKYRVDNFVLISTDKAVRPTNIMGATKRICEMIIQTYAKKSEHTRFAAVRFGNVLGSNGSVIPLFLKQIEEGGPVTVTDREITRFFMTIPEAVSLVLQAGLFAEGGEIFVLDMGEPVKIYDLAKNLIKMKGYEPGRDIEIEIVGLRPGEKLYEEILMDEEGLDKTENNMIHIGKPIKMDEEKFLRNLDMLIEEAFRNGNHIKECTEKVCSTYTITDN